MPWSTPFPQPIILKDGRRITTLDAAARFMLGLPELTQRAPWWQYAVELVMAAAEKDGDIEEARNQMGRALSKDGFL